VNGEPGPTSDCPVCICTAPADTDVHTLRNLGPQAGLAGLRQGTRHLDVKPRAERPKKQAHESRGRRLARPSASGARRTGTG